MFSKQYNSDAVKSPKAAHRRPEGSANIKIAANKDQAINDASE